MIIVSEHLDLQTTDGGSMGTFVARPKAPRQYPGILFYSDIFQLTGTMLRSCARLAGYGFVVAAPEIYRRVEPPGFVIPFDNDGRDRGMADAGKIPVAHFDEDCSMVLDYLATHPAVAPSKIGVAGFCIGGHLAFRGAMHPSVRATTCFYGTGIHDGKLGADGDARSLQRAAEIRGELLLIWGARDPHIPEDGRRSVAGALQNAGVNFSQRTFEAEHAFMRDEGARYDSEATDQAFEEMISFYRRIFRV